MTFWWANQKENYPDAIAERSLWTCPRPKGRTLDEGRAYIKDLRRGDVVFHYHDKHIRAVSTVTQELVPHPRSPAYRAREGEGNDGWLVRVSPIRTDLNLHFSRVAELIRIGMPGPLNRSQPPRPQQGRYLSLLSDADGRQLLRELSIEAPLSDDGFFGRPSGYWDGDETDSLVIAELRNEQGKLRKALLGGRHEATCAMCGRLLPNRMLIAGHIKPRSKCSEEERRNYRTVAMLICALGCDALFEWGYIVVHGSGVIGRGRTTETPDLEHLVERLVDEKCSAHTEETAPNFAAHMNLHGFR